MASSGPTFFSTPAALRAWLAKYHATERELVVGLYKKDSGKPSITWPELVEELLCYGWIDGVRKSLGEESYTIRVTPRKATSNWSNVNLGLMERLRKEGRMTPAGDAAFAARDPARDEVYSFEQAEVAFDVVSAKRFRANKAAWAFFKEQAPSYQKAATWWVGSAMKDETRERRLGQLIECSEQAERLPHLTSPARKTSGKKDA